MTIFTHDIIPGEFEKNYSRLRQSEGRIYSDPELLHLPQIRRDHPYYQEWQMRKMSCRRLIHYLEKKQIQLAPGAYLRILEVGCGNGWLSHRLAAIPGTKVLGSDINFSEIQQAGRVFYDIPNLHFIYGDIESDLFKDQQFDQVIFAASIQYFSSLPAILTRTFRLLKKDGEVQILDTPFYAEEELEAARKRSQFYYQSIGFPEMASWYFHHSKEELSGFRNTVLYNPDSLSNRITKNRNVFPWIRIQP